VVTLVHAERVCIADCSKQFDLRPQTLCSRLWVTPRNDVMCPCSRLEAAVGAGNTELGRQIGRSYNFLSILNMGLRIVCTVFAANTIQTMPNSSLDGQSE